MVRAQKHLVLREGRRQEKHRLQVQVNRSVQNANRMGKAVKGLRIMLKRLVRVEGLKRVVNGAQIVAQSELKVC